MKSSLGVFAVIAGVVLSGVVHADQTYVCTYGEKERVINVIYPDQERPVPCEVRYSKEGSTEVLWRAENQAGYCEEKAQAFIKQHLEWGWRCGGGTQGASPLTGPAAVPSSDEVAHYRRNAHIAQAISTAGVFRMEEMNFFMENGRYPTSVEELGYAREDMRTSSHFSDLRIGEEGAILIKGNENTGTDTVITLSPRMVLGGSSIEWGCAINVRVGTGLNCNYDPQLRF